MTKLFWLALLCCNAITSIAQDLAVNSVDGLAAGGFDVVSYFEDGPLPGSSEYSATFQEAEYYFANPDNLDKFNNEPLKYLPEYGGWCAYAMGVNGTKVSVDPETFKIINGKLYLFYKAPLNNTLKKWNKKEETLLPSADANWNLNFNMEDHE